MLFRSQQADEADRKLKEKELKALLARDEELDGLFERIYEDNVSCLLYTSRNDCHYRPEWRWKIYSGPLYLRTGKEVWPFAG